MSELEEVADAVERIDSALLEQEAKPLVLPIRETVDRLGARRVVGPSFRQADAATRETPARLPPALPTSTSSSSNTQERTSAGSPSVRRARPRGRNGSASSDERPSSRARLPQLGGGRLVLRPEMTFVGRELGGRAGIGSPPPVVA